MNLQKISILLLSTLFLASSCSNDESNDSGVTPTPTPTPTPVATPIFLADPTIFYHNNTYYLYGTSQGDLVGLGNGFLVYTSTNLVDWDGPEGNTQNGFALHENNAFGNTGFWAPQIFEYNNSFYMAYTANEKIAIATSDSPLGPFINSGDAIDTNVNQIDPYIFIDDDGKKYLYHVRLDNGNKIYVAEMNDDMLSIKPSTLTEIITSQEYWENTQNVNWKVVEGPTVFKHNNLYYLTYSANDYRNQDYAVGYATASSPMGPWTKNTNNPIIHGDDVGAYGTGHGDLFIDENNNMQYVLHGHYSVTSVEPRKSGIITLDWDNNELIADPDSFRFFEQMQ
ncbi:glycoside hydrolase family 43 protein [Neptunitalea lumnitzerae]|uniref:Beta-xylosidase n=1 Tax=Neptunitalea lumnitzerae TaxID=2965509 RepID=A0ABQ5MJJ8_9FLAO|nr:glycoside hydrolase family 43 protein [Neptunitalea sp. Y10]GLB49591.1 beta-xylosidase [Neptunitalea sp. Y10]